MKLRYASAAAGLTLGIAIVTVAVWKVSAQADTVSGGANVATVAEEAPIVDIDKDATPMAQRVATIGFLNKRNGLARDFKMKPGDNFRVADGVVIRLRACDKTAPWEQEPYTGAFVQLDVENAAHQSQRIFSGWVYKESPSLNVVEHPIYDVWVKDCQMNHGEPAPSAHATDGGETAAAHHVSKAKKSDAANSGDTAPAETPAPADGGGDTAIDNKPQ